MSDWLILKPPHSFVIHVFSINKGSLAISLQDYTELEVIPASVLLGEINELAFPALYKRAVFVLLSAKK